MVNFKLKTCVDWNLPPCPVLPPKMPAKKNPKNRFVRHFAPWRTSALKYDFVGLGNYALHGNISWKRGRCGDRFFKWKEGEQLTEEVWKICFHFLYIFKANRSCSIVLAPKPQHINVDSLCFSKLHNISSFKLEV